MTITWQAEDTVEPIADTTIEGIANFANYSVESGCAQTYSGANMTVTIASGFVFHNGTYTVVAGNDVTLVADATNPRWTWIGVASTGTAEIVSGTAAATPTVPEIGDRVPLALVYVQANLTVANNATYKLDKRVLYPYQNAFDAIRAQFRASRRLYAEAGYPSVPPGVGDSLSGLGGSVGWSGSGGSVTNTAASGTVDAYVSCTTYGANSVWWGSNNTGATNTFAAVRPDKNPRMLIRWFPGSSNANLTTTLAGFVAGGSSISATLNGAYLRANTTGNLFAVTRQGASETTTDLGARPTTPTSYEIYTDDAGVTWKFRNDTTAAQVASHTGNVPTATTPLAYIFGGISGSGSLNAFNIVYVRVEAGMGAA